MKCAPFLPLAVAVLGGALLLGSSCLERNRTPPEAVRGTLNLTRWDFASGFSVPLAGEWLFLWGSWMNPTGPFSPEESQLIEVPGTWNGHRLPQGGVVGPFGWGTYALRVLLPESAVGAPLALSIDFMYTAYELWANGVCVTSNGVVGTSRATAVPQYFHRTAVIVPRAAALDVYVRVSNYSHWTGGMPEPIRLSSPEDALKLRENGIAYDLVIASALFLLGFFLLLAYFIRRRDPGILSLGLSCLSIAVRALFVGTRLISTLFPSFSWDACLRADFFSLFIFIPLFLFYLKSQFKEETIRWVAELVTVVLGAFAFLVLATPPYFFTRLYPYFQIVSILSAGFGLVIILRAVRRKRIGSTVLLAGALVFFLCAVNDGLHDNGLIRTGDFGPLGLFLFAAAQTFFVAFRPSSPYRLMESPLASSRPFAARVSMEAAVTDQPEETEGVLVDEAVKR